MRTKIASVFMSVSFLEVFSKEVFSKPLLSIYLMVLLICFPTSSFAGSDLHEGISARIETVLSEYSSNDALKIKVSYTNVSSEDIRFLKWNTALEGYIRHDFIEVWLEGEKIAYTGIHVKRLPPKDSDYIILKPSETASEIVDLADGYEISQKGNYTLMYEGSGHADDEQSLKIIGGATLNVTEVRKVSAKVELKQTPIIDSSCNSTQVTQINQALTIAEQISITARDALNNAPVDQRASAERYLEWFGAYSEARYETVRSGMQKITDALINQRIGFDCTCNIDGRENVFAFVFTNDPFNMNVCPVFFLTTPAGTDSRAGTIIHEISHFNVVAGTDDFSSALNQSGSRSLANSNPANAIRNANAFEYFAENTPFLSMPVATSEPDPELDGELEEIEEEIETEEEQRIIITPILPLLLEEEA